MVLIIYTLLFMTYRQFFSALLCLSLFCGCKVFRLPEFRMPENLDVEVLRWENGQPFIRTSATCYNQNGMGFWFKGGEVKIYLDTLLLGNAKIDTTFFVPKHTEFKIPAYLRLDLAYLSQHGLKLDSTVLSLNGKFKGSAFGLNKSLKIKYKGMHNINLIMKPF